MLILLGICLRPKSARFQAWQKNNHLLKGNPHCQCTQIIKTVKSNAILLPIHSIHFGTNPPIHHTLKKLTSPSIERRHSPKFSQALMQAFQATTSRCTSARCMVSRRLKASGHRLPALESGGPDAGKIWWFFEGVPFKFVDCTSFEALSVWVHMIPCQCSKCGH